MLVRAKWLVNWVKELDEITPGGSPVHLGQTRRRAASGRCASSCQQGVIVQTHRFVQRRGVWQYRIEVSPSPTRRLTRISLSSRRKVGDEELFPEYHLKKHGGPRMEKGSKDQEESTSRITGSKSCSSELLQDSYARARGKSQT